MRAFGGALSVAPFTTGLALGEGGMDRPRRGVRVPLWVRAPGMGGRRTGAGEDIAGGGLGGDASSEDGGVSWYEDEDVSLGGFIYCTCVWRWRCWGLLLQHRLPAEDLHCPASDE